MSKVSESIWSNKDAIIPMAEVSFINKVTYGIEIVMKHSKWQNEVQHWSPVVFLSSEEAGRFINDWCYYRAELEGVTLEKEKTPN